MLYGHVLEGDLRDCRKEDRGARETELMPGGAKSKKQ